MFDSMTIDHILTIPIAPNDREDKMFWSLTKDGSYTVKSGYWFSMGGPLDDAHDGGGLC